jgi:hypothetical protein
MRSRLWREILPKVLILIYRVGEGGTPQRDGGVPKMGTPTNKFEEGLQVESWDRKAND